MSESEKGIKPIIDDEGKLLYIAKEFNGHLYESFKDLVEKLERCWESFPVRDNDIYLLNYPKSGTHWSWEILMMLTHSSAENRTEPKQAMMLEMEFDPSSDLLPPGSRRIINTHLRYDDMPPDVMNNTSGKIIQVIRNPADVAVSIYHHMKQFKPTELTYDWNEFITKLYLNNQLMPYSTWFDYTCQWWSQCIDKPNYLPVFYEDLQEKPLETIKKMADFIEVDVDDVLLQKIVTQSSFEQMKKAKHDSEVEALKHVFPPGYSMYRKGVVGDSKNYFTKEQLEQLTACFDEKLKEFPVLHQRYAKYLKM